MVCRACNKAPRTWIIVQRFAAEEMYATGKGRMVHGQLVRTFVVSNLWGRMNTSTGTVGKDHTSLDVQRSDAHCVGIVSPLKTV